MSLLTDYYFFQHLPENKSATRFDCLASTGSNPELEALRNKVGRLFFYYGALPENFRGSAKRKADKALTKTKNISSVFFPDISKPLAFGDIRGTQDALLFVFNGDFSEFELYVARGQRNNRNSLFNLLADNELNEEMAELRKKAKNE